jgi:hypothetical protein
LLAPGVTFVGTSGSFRDKADYIASRERSWIPRASSYSIDGLAVRFYGDTAVVTGHEATTGAGVASQGRFTHVWVHRQGRWRLVAIQRTEISFDRKRRQTLRFNFEVQHDLVVMEALIRGFVSMSLSRSVV